MLISYPIIAGKSSEQAALALIEYTLSKCLVDPIACCNSKDASYDVHWHLNHLKRREQRRLHTHLISSPFPRSIKRAHPNADEMNDADQVLPRTQLATLERKRLMEPELRLPRRERRCVRPVVQYREKALIHDRAGAWPAGSAGRAWDEADRYAVLLQRGRRVLCHPYALIN